VQKSLPEDITLSGADGSNKTANSGIGNLGIITGLCFNRDYLNGVNQNSRYQIRKQNTNFLSSESKILQFLHIGIGRTGNSSNISE